MQNIVDKLKNEQNRSSTKANYYSIWKKFNLFFIQLDIKPDSWEERLILFVGYLIDKRRKSSTIRSYISAIKSVLKQDGEDLKENVYLLKSLTKACKLKNDKVHTQLPIRKNLLKLIVDNVHKIFKSPQEYLVKMYQALFITAYYGLFRIGELTFSQHAIKAKDVHIGVNKNKLMFILHSSKTHWYDTKPQIVKISEEQRRNKQSKTLELHCPFLTLKEYVAARGKRSQDTEQFFVFRDGTPVLPKHARWILRNILTYLGLEHSLYNFHGMRGGRATDLAEMGVDLGTIKILGRWKSSAVFAYLKT